MKLQNVCTERFKKPTISFDENFLETMRSKKYLRIRILGVLTHLFPFQPLFETGRGTFLSGLQEISERRTSVYDIVPLP